jgi:excisionase family DNA binding protein
MGLSRDVGAMALAGVARDIITAPIGEFCRITGLGVTKTYELINEGEIKSITIGKRRLIVMESWHRLIERRLGTPAESPAASPPRPGAKAA